MEKRLFRNEHDKVIAGISSGLADYTQVDATIIRLLFIASTIFLVGGGLLVYIILWIILPVNNDPTAKFSKFNEYFKQGPQESMFNSANAFNNPYNSGEQTKWNTENANNYNPQMDFSKFKKNNDTSKTVVGLILLLLGVYFLLRQWDLVPYWFNIFKIYKLWPLAIIAIGVSLIFKNQRKTDWDTFKKNGGPEQKENKAPVGDATIVSDSADQTEKPTY